MNIRGLIRRARGISVARTEPDGMWLEGPTCHRYLSGLVILEGYAVGSSVSSGDQLILTLPEGYRPQQTLYRTLVYTAGLTKIPTATIVTIDESGECRAKFAASPAPVMDFTGVTFRSKESK